MNKLEQNLDYQYQKTCGISFQVTSLAINHHLIESCVSLSFFLRKKLKPMFLWFMNLHSTLHLHSAFGFSIKKSLYVTFFQL